MESSGNNYLRRRNRRTTVVMLAGWLSGLGVYGGSYLYAQREAQAAAARAQTIWNNPEGINPSSLPEMERIALLDLIKPKRGPASSNLLGWRPRIGEATRWENVATLKDGSLGQNRHVWYVLHRRSQSHEGFQNLAGHFRAPWKIRKISTTLPRTL